MEGTQNSLFCLEIDCFVLKKKIVGSLYLVISKLITKLL